MIQQARIASGTNPRTGTKDKAGLDRKSSLPTTRTEAAAPPPYSAAAGAGKVGLAGKKAPPPPPPLKPKSGAAPKVFCTAIFDYEAQVRIPYSSKLFALPLTKSRPRATSRSALATVSRLWSALTLPRTGGPARSTVARVSSPATILR
jgi:hypothetical protein